MKSVAHLASMIFALFGMPSCDSPKGSIQKITPSNAAEIEAETPILSVTQGDHWIYNVHLEIPADVTAAGASAVDTNHPLTRTYIGKIPPADGLPRVDCFEVVAPAMPVEREFVEIHPDRILMRGSMLMRPETTHPMWLDHPVPFVIAGMKPGTESPEIKTGDGALSRKTQVVARESVTVPAGSYPSIRLVMTGMDGDLELRRTIWFAPGTGIVREEKIRYRLGKLIFRETHELIKTSVGIRK